MRRASCFDEVGEVWSGAAGARAVPMRAVRANSQEAFRDERYGHGRELLREERLLGVACANSTAASAIESCCIDIIFHGQSCGHSC